MDAASVYKLKIVLDNVCFCGLKMTSNKFLQMHRPPSSSDWNAYKNVESFRFYYSRYTSILSKINFPIKIDKQVNVFHKIMKRITVNKLLYSSEVITIWNLLLL